MVGLKTGFYWYEIGNFYILFFQQYHFVWKINFGETNTQLL